MIYHDQILNHWFNYKIAYGKDYFTGLIEENNNIKLCIQSLISFEENNEKCNICYENIIL